MDDFLVNLEKYKFSLLLCAHMEYLGHLVSVSSYLVPFLVLFVLVYVVVIEG